MIKRWMITAVGGLAVGAAVQASVMPWTVKAMRWQAGTSTVTEVVPPTPSGVTNDFTIRFLTGTFPATLTVGLTPSVTNAAQYDPGDGVWRVYSARTITLAAGSTYISFRGSWTNSSRTYDSLFKGTLNSSAYTCQTEGSFSNTPAMTGAYSEMFANSLALVSVTTNPLPVLTGTASINMFYRTFQNCYKLTNIASGTLNSTGVTGAPAISMFNQTFYNCNLLASIPAGTLYSSGLTGAPAQSMFNGAFANCTLIKTVPSGTLNSTGVTGAPASSMFWASFQACSGLTNIPDGTLNSTGVTGTPAANMFNATFYSCSGLTNIPTGTLTASGLSGAPAANMIQQTFQNCSGIVAGDYNISSNVTFATNNIASSMPSAFAGMTKWTGTVYWGTNRIYEAITNPATDANTFQNSTLVPGYGTMGENWK